MANDAHGIIYKITNLVNNKVYIGQTTRNFNMRYSAAGKCVERVYGYLCGCERYGYCHNVHLLRSIRKYGVDNFKVDEIFDVAYSQEELDEKEKYWINYYNACNPDFGYNSRLGGIEGKIGKDYYLKKLKNNTICPIICLETGEMFISKAEAISKLNISNVKIENINKYNRYNSYKIKNNYDIKDKYTFLKLNNCNPKHKPIICITNRKIYTTYLAVNRELFNNSYGKEILACCNNELEFILRKPSKKSIRKIPYKFVYAVDYLIDSKF